MFSTASVVIPRDSSCMTLFVTLMAITAGLGMVFLKLATDILEWYVTIIGILWIVGVYQLFVYFSSGSRKARAADKVMKDIKGKYIPLLEKETQMLDIPTPTLYTVFEGNNSCDREDTINWIKNRVRVMVDRNPFLVGRLRTDPGYSVPSIWVPCQNKSAEFIDKTFEKFLTEISIEDDVEGFKKANLPNKEAVVGCGETLLDEPDKLISKFTILKSAKNDKKFAIMFSMSHVVGDGYSLYKLYGMLDPATYPTDEDVPSLTIDRDVRYDQKLHHLQHDGRQHFKKFGFFFKEQIMDYLGRTFLPYIGKKTQSQEFREKRVHRYFKIRKDWIDQEKKKYQQVVATTAAEYYENQKKNFALMQQRTGMPVQKTKKLKADEEQLVDINISANDVLSKYIFENFYAHRNCPMYGCAYEFRSRFFVAPYLPPKPLDPTLVGNYYELLLFTREEAADPLKIRRLVNSKGRSSEINKEEYDEKDVVPEGGNKFSRAIPLLSNWTTFYVDLKFPGFKVALHAPVGAEDEKTLAIEPLAAIFVCNGNGDLAVMNTCDVQPKNDKEAPLDGEWVF